MTTGHAPDRTPEMHDWREAGEAWGSHAADWSCLFEHYSVDVLVALFTRLGVGPGTELLDVACGSGLAVRIASAMGATVSGIDAAAELVGVARERTPGADVRVGSMYALPWADESFDAAVSVNGIWGGCEAALDETFRVLRPGGLVGVAFWGPGPPLDIGTFFRIFAVHAPDGHRRSMRRLNDIAAPGVAEQMLAASGFSVLERGARTSVIEWPDVALAWRAISSLGPAVPALRTNDRAVLEREVLEALEPCRDSRGVYRARSDQQFVVARKP
ncbi:MAG TPA: class I SAM-dependent methyltransferase [Acidimicrobiia bacterium]|nr:class I SAM-dependent methyltransferase [Acidimicrobiia bacterium]